MLRNGDGNIEWLQFPTLLRFPEIEHAVFPSKGGYSKAPYSSLNCSLSVGDEKENVYKNRAIVQSVVGAKSLYFPQQVHGINIQKIEQDTTCLEGDADALITQDKGKALAILHADCQAALFYDPSTQVIAAVHAGWRGLIQSIYTKVLDKLEKEMCVKRGNLQVAIAPSLGPCCAQFLHYKEELPETMWDFQRKDNYFDLWAFSRFVLEESGIPEENIEISSICTKCHTDFFSYRRNKITGRNSSVIMLR